MAAAPPAFHVLTAQLLVFAAGFIWRCHIFGKLIRLGAPQGRQRGRAVKAVCRKVSPAKPASGLGSARERAHGPWLGAHACLGVEYLNLAWKG